MQVLKVVAEGVTTSFRYPHFMQSIHPTFEMPPPSTIYGHVASALGEWFDPVGVQFAYHFTYEARVSDLEHIIVAVAGTGKLPGTELPQVLQGAVNPFSRELLFKPRMVLYLNMPEWEPAFRSPHYAVVLGRSQDLFSYRSVSVVDLQQTEEAYLEHTLLPYDMAVQTQRGYTVLMPRYLDHTHNRNPVFARYLVLHDRVTTRELQQFGNDSPVFWADPETRTAEGLPLGLVFHTFVGESDESLRLA
ncbi:MAG: CRISPR-associated protein Cas5 [Anaerolineae bacterium]